VGGRSSEQKHSGVAKIFAGRMWRGGGCGCKKPFGRGGGGGQEKKAQTRLGCPRKLCGIKKSKWGSSGAHGPRVGVKLREVKSGVQGPNSQTSKKEKGAFEKKRTTFHKCTTEMRVNPWHTMGRGGGHGHFGNKRRARQSV